MTVLKPCTDDGLLEVGREGRGIVIRILVDGGGHLVLELKDAEAFELKDVLAAAEHQACARETDPSLLRRVSFFVIWANVQSGAGRGFHGAGLGALESARGVSEPARGGG